MAENDQNAQTIADLIADLLEPRDDIASASASGRFVALSTQAGELFVVEVSAVSG